MKSNTLSQKRDIRHKRIRAKLKGSSERPRLAVYRSNSFMYAQLIDDRSGKTLGHADDRTMKTKGKLARAGEVGMKIAELAKEKKITEVVFDRGGFKFTGRIKAVAEGARKGGLTF